MSKKTPENQQNGAQKNLNSGLYLKILMPEYWYTRNVPVLTNTGTFQYLGPEVYFFSNTSYLNSYINIALFNQFISE